MIRNKANNSKNKFILFMETKRKYASNCAGIIIEK